MFPHAFALIQPAHTMYGSIILALTLVGVGILVAAIVYLIGTPVARARGASMTQLKRISLGILILFAIVGVAAGVYDANKRRNTLAEGTLHALHDGEGPASLTFDFTVKHPGVEHGLHVFPLADSGVTPDFPFEVAVQVVHGDEAPVIDMRHTFIPERFGQEGRLDWNFFDTTFTPPKAGRYELRARVTTPKVPNITFTITDPDHPTVFGSSDQDRLPSRPRTADGREPSPLRERNRSMTFARGS